MKTAAKFFGLLIAFLIVMSINVNDKPIFAYVYDFISPATNSAQDATEGFFKRSMSSTSSYSKKLFDNSVPRVKDSVKSQLSSSRKQVAEPAERITEEEKEQLDDLIKNHD